MKFRILLPVLFAVIAAGSLFRCADTSELPRTRDNFIGTWHLVRQEGREEMYGRKSTWVIEYRTMDAAIDTDEETYYEAWTFGADNVCVETKGCGGKTLQTDCYGYACLNDTLVVQDRPDRTGYRVEKLTASQLVLSETTDGSYGKSAWTLTYERCF